MDVVKTLKSCRTCIHGLSDICICAIEIEQVIGTMADGFFSDTYKATENQLDTLGKYCNRYKNHENYKDDASS